MTTGETDLTCAITRFAQRAANFVELRGIEPLASTVRLLRSTN
jgi:hypothetical protein